MKNVKRVLEKIRYTDEKAAAIFILIVFMLLMAPVIYIGKYDAPAADDYSYSVLTHRAWENTHSVFEVLKAAAQQAEISHRTWQGTYSSIFMMSLMPTVFDYRLYKLVPAIMVFMMCFSAFVLSRTLLRDLAGLKHQYWLIIGAALSIISVEKVYTIPSGLFWYNAAVHYTFMHAVAILMISAMMQMMLADTWWKKILWLIISVFTAIGTAGSNYATCLIGLVSICSLSTILFFFYRKNALLNLLPLTAYAAGFAVNVGAPGNAVRGALFQGMGVLPSILNSFKSAFLFMGKWMDMFILLFLILLIPVLWNAMQKISFRFPMPGLVALYCFCILASGFTASWYSGGTEGISRLHNVVRTTYFYFLVFNEAYFIGWLQKKIPSIKKEVRLHTGFLVIVVLLMTYTVFNAQNKIGTFTTYAAVHYLKTNEAALFYAEYMERKAILEDETVENVVLKPYVNRPWLLYLNNITELTEDESDWRNAAVRDFYGKVSVRIALPAE